MHLAGLAGGEDAVVPVTTNGPEPLHALYHRSCLPPAERAYVQALIASAFQEVGLR